MNSSFIKNLNKLFIKYTYILWLMGLLFPCLYLILITNIKKIISTLRTPNVLLQYFLIFLFIQVISVLLSFNSEYYSNERFFAMLHNILAYSFLFVGYAFIDRNSNRELLKKYLGKLFWLVFFSVVFLSVISIFFSNHFTYYGLPGLLGINTKFNAVNFFFLDYYLFPNFPRTTILSVYPNASAITVFLIHSLYVFLNYTDIKHKKFIYSHLALVFIIFMTGSRLYLVLSLILFVSIFINSRKRLLIVLLSVIVFLPIVFLLFQFLYASRSGSNVARIIIYFESFKYMIENNLVFGLGLKPRLNDLLGLPYPIGSHSTLIGYFVKNGLLGGFYILIIYLIFPIYYLASLINMVRTKYSWNNYKFYINTILLLLLVMSLTEDIDVFELIPFFIGMILWMFINRKKQSLNNELVK